MSNITQVAVQYGWISARLWFGRIGNRSMLRYTAISHGYECVSLLCLYNSSMTQVCKYIRNNNGVSLKALFSTSFCHGLKSQVDSLTAEPKLPFLIRKHHFRTSNEGTLSWFIKSLFSLKWLKAHCIMKSIRHSECDYLHLIQHSFFSSISYSQ